MRSIVVTIPKTKIAEVEAEEVDVARRMASGEEDIVYYWKMGRLPKERPNRIYFAWDGAVRAYHDVVMVAFDRLYMAPQIHTLKEPVPMESFRGFRYFEEKVS